METFVRFSQSTGAYDLITEDGGVEVSSEHIGTGWAGCGEGKNNPSMQGVKNVGPLPRGNYHIGPPKNESTGPYSLRLTPFPDTQMLGRSGFLIHGPAQDPSIRGEESHGCPILVRLGRMHIVSSGADRFEVVE